MLNEVDQDLLTVTIQKHVLNFCKILPTHIEKWRSLLAEAEKPVKALVNYSEQMRHVERANIKYIEGFLELKEKLLFKIYSEIDDEVLLIKGVIDRLHLTNQEVKNKLIILEKSTIDLNWEEDSTLIIGSAFQPPLYRILQNGYEFSTYFLNALKSIQESFKSLNLRNEEVMKNFETNFNVDLNKKNLTGFLAVTQYVGNEKDVI